MNAYKLKLIQADQDLARMITHAVKLSKENAKLKAKLKEARKLIKTLKGGK